MVLFLADRTNLQHKRLHDRIQNRLSTECDDVRRRRTDPREAGPYRVVGTVRPRAFLDDEGYPVRTARIEIGFQLRTGDPSEHYWFNWVEPERSLLVGWHQDDTHEEFGPVHLQVTDGSKGVDHRRVRFIDSHPLDVVARRFGELQSAVLAVEWEDGRPVGFDPSAGVFE